MCRARQKMAAEAIIPPKINVTEKGNTEHIRVWKVPRNKNHPEGICYSFRLISNRKRVLGYDNNTGEGHHKHFIKDGKLVKTKVDYSDWRLVLLQFKKDVETYERDETERD